MKIIPNTNDRLFLTKDKQVFNSKKKKYCNVDSGTLRTHIDNRNISMSIEKLHRLLYPECYDFLKKDWYDIENFQGLYKINNEGEILSVCNNMVLKPKQDKDGYLLVNLYKGGKSYSMKIHRLVAKTFLQTGEKETINHIDGNKQNNKVENLEWANRGENNKHAYKSGLKVQKAEYLKKKVKIIKDGIATQFDSIKECSNFLNCDQSFVAKVARGKRKTCKGYKVEYVL